MPGTQFAAAFSPRLPDWYQLCFEAAKEADGSEAVVKLKRACNAIAKRLIEARSGSLQNLQELDDLHHASIYLRLLLLNTDIKREAPHESCRHRISAQT
jgi:hypothetical protein